MVKNIHLALGFLAIVVIGLSICFKTTLLHYINIGNFLGIPNLLIICEIIVLAFVIILSRPYD